MARDLRCACGAMHWTIAPTAPGTRLRCYCSDCQAYAAALGAETMMDDKGGTELFQTLPSAVAITQGAEHLANLRLTPKGLLRWYAGCCKTPIANTLNGPGLPFVGMVVPANSDGYGPLVACVMTKSAKGEVRQYGFARTGMNILARGLGARLRGDSSGAPFFAAGQPVRTPVILSEGGTP